jgi:16S rRNA processing protein RimM
MKKQSIYTEIGFIRKASGFKGEVIIALHAGDAEDFARNNFFFLDMNGSKVPFLVEGFSDESGNVVVKFEDVDTHEAATAIVSRKVFLTEDELPGSFAVNDFNNLTGYSVIDKERGMLGTVKSVSEMPGQIIIAFNYSGAEILLPLHDETLLKVLKKKKELHVALPDGLLEVYIKNSK